MEVDNYTSSGVKIREYTAKFADSFYVSAIEGASKKTPGKNVWSIWQEQGDFPFDLIVSDSFDPNDEAKSLASLKAALKKVQL